MAHATVAYHAPELRGYGNSHERAALVDICTRLAVLKGHAFVGEQAEEFGATYLVPSRTLVGVKQAALRGIASEQDLFGGVVPFDFVASKAVVHGLVAPDAPAPPGWSVTLSALIGDAVLPGYSVFCLRDAMRAAALLAARGPIRLKPVHGTGGRGQRIAADIAAAEAMLSDIGSELWRDGLVLETDLAGVATYSVGQVRVAELVASYFGTQLLTTDNKGLAVYGGSDLTMARGGYDALRALRPASDIDRAIDQACRFEDAVMTAFPEIIASRRNYDVGCGRDMSGRMHSGVLDQSWRVGGASAAEIAALEAFRADPGCRLVRASTTEVYGADAVVPPDAKLTFTGVDDRVGPIAKYYRVEVP